MQKITREQLIACGFCPVIYKGQPGEFLAKDMIAQEMSDFMAHIVHHGLAKEMDRIRVEVCPNNTVQWSNFNAEYYESGIPLDSKRGIAILQDAGFSFCFQMNNEVPGIPLTGPC